MKRHELLSQFQQFTKDLEIDKSIKEVITENLKKQPVRILKQSKEKLKQTRKGNKNLKQDKLNSELGNLVRNSIDKVSKKDRTVIQPSKKIEKDNVIRIKQEAERKMVEKVINKGGTRLKVGVRKPENTVKRRNIVNQAKKPRTGKEDLIENRQDIKGDASNLLVERNGSEEVEKEMPKQVPERSEPLKNTRKSAFIALNVFKASEEMDKKLKVANISKFNTTKTKRKRVCMPKAKPKKPLADAVKIERRGRKKKIIDENVENQNNENSPVVKIEEKTTALDKKTKRVSTTQRQTIDKINKDKNISIQECAKLKETKTTEVKVIQENICEYNVAPEKSILKNTILEVNPSMNTITRENIALKDAFMDLKNVVYNKTQIEPKREIAPEKDSFPIFPVKKDRSLEDIKRDVEILMPKTTYLFKDEYTRVENLAPKKAPLFGNEYFKKIRCNLLRKDTDPNNYVSKVKVNHVDYNHDFETCKGEAWTHGVDHSIKTQKHAAIEQIFNVPGPVDVISMFPNEKNVCNDSPNKFVKRF